MPTDEPTIVASSPQILFRGNRFCVERMLYQVGDCSVEKEIVRHPGAVVVLPLLDESHLCLIRNFRPAVGSAMLELPAGTLEPNEDPWQTAQRELQEETGYRASSWSSWYPFYMSPGVMDEKMHLFVASGLTAGAPERQPGEHIENVICTWSDVRQWIAQGEIRDAKTLVGLLLYMNRFLTA